jgi:hypothetical protein
MSAVDTFEDPKITRFGPLFRPLFGPLFDPFLSPFDPPGACILA